MTENKKFKLTGEPVTVVATQAGFCPDFHPFTNRNGGTMGQYRRPGAEFTIDKAYLSDKWMKVVGEPKKKVGRPPKSSKVEKTDEDEEKAE